MGRPTTGPRRNSKSNPMLYAFLKHGGKLYKESLRTADKGLALDRYPAAMRRLKLKAQGIKTVEVIRPTDAVQIWDVPDGMDMTPANLDAHGFTREQQASEVLDPDAFVISWEEALAIHIQRQAEKRGRSISQGTLKGMRYAIADMTAAPGDVTTQDIRDFLAKLKARGLAALTISQRASLLQGITQTLVKQDLIESNPWQRVDFSAKSKKHIREATPREIKTIVESGNAALTALAFSGMRVGELCSREPSHLDDGWLTINDTATWRPKSEGSERRLPIPEWIDLQLPTRKKSSMHNDITALCPGLSCHGLRHSYKTAIRESGIPFDVGGFILGHAAPGGDISSRYGRFSDEAVLSSNKKVWAVIDQWIGGRADA